MITKEQLAKLIDYTLLKPDTTEDSVRKLCEEAKKYKFCSVCVNPTYISLASSILSGTDVKVCGVIGFPLGASTPEVKVLEAERAVINGASEIDMVINIGALKSHNYGLIKREIFEVVKRARTCQKDITVKVIIETGLLTKADKEVACKLIKETGANFVKTSTGFNASGATVYDVKLLKKILKKVGPNIKVKASGGIRTFHEAIKLIKAGADRIGTSSGVAIMKQYSIESHGKNANLKEKNVNYVYFLCLINWQTILKSGELNKIKNYIKESGKSHESIGDWIKVDLGWENVIGNRISKSELGFYHSRLIFKFRLQKPPNDITETREIREELEEKIIEFCGDKNKGFIKQIKDYAKPPYIFTYPIFELNKKVKFWKPPEQRPYSLQTTCFYTKLNDPKWTKRKVKMRISGAQIIATNMSKWFFETLVNIIFHEGLYRQTRDEKLIERDENKLIYRNLENRLENFASSLMTIFHQYSSHYSRRNLQIIALSASIIGIALGLLYFFLK